MADAYAVKATTSFSIMGDGGRKYDISKNDFILPLIHDHDAGMGYWLMVRPDNIAAPLKMRIPLETTNTLWAKLLEEKSIEVLYSEKLYKEKLSEAQAYILESRKAEQTSTPPQNTEEKSNKGVIIGSILALLLIGGAVWVSKSSNKNNQDE